MKLDTERNVLTIESTGRSYQAAKLDTLAVGVGDDQAYVSGVCAAGLTPAEKREVAAHAIALWQAWGKPFAWKADAKTLTHTLDLGSLTGQVFSMYDYGGKSEGWYTAELFTVKPAVEQQPAETRRVYASVARSVEEAKKAVEAAIDAQPPTSP